MLSNFIQYGYIYFSHFERWPDKTRKKLTLVCNIILISIMFFPLIVVLQEADMLVVKRAQRGTHCKSSQLYSLPLLPPSSTATVLLLLRLWLATCKPYRGIFKRVCGRLSNCDSVWLLPTGSGTVTAAGKSKLHGQTSCLCLWIFSVFLIQFIAPVSPWISEDQKKESQQQHSVQIRMMSFIVV